MAAIIFYAIVCRVLPKEVISVAVVTGLLLLLSGHFYLYVNRLAKSENQADSKVEYSWGYIKEKTVMLDLNMFFSFLKNKDYGFYKQYLRLNFDKFTIALFFLADIVIAFKNLDLYNSGAYFALSFATKFVFVAYVYVENFYKLVDVSDNDRDRKILDIFYRQINGVISVFFVVFIMVFILSKYIVEIVFGNYYISEQSSLPFILLANMFLTIALIVYSTAKRIDLKNTRNILRIYAPIFLVLFIFMSINYVDTVTYFVVGASCLLSIFLYNFAIKKLDYISDTYNHLF